MNPWPALIARYGIELAFKIFQTFQNKQDPTEADWLELIALVNKTQEQYDAEARARLVASGQIPPQ